MSCSIEIGDNKVLLALKRKLCNDTKFIEYYVKVCDSNNEFKPEFIEWCKKNGYSTTKVRIDAASKSTIDKTIEAIRVYSGSSDYLLTVQEGHGDTSIASYGYTNLKAKDQAIAYSAGFVLTYITNLYLTEGIDLKDKVKQLSKKYNKELTKENVIISQLSNNIKNHIIDRLVNDYKIKKEVATQLVQTKNIAGIEKIIGDSNDVATINLLAVYKELIANAKGFYNSVIIHPKLSNIRLESAITEFDVIDDESVDDYTDPNKTDGDLDEDVPTTKDQTIKQLDDKMGINGNALDQFDGKTKDYFNSIPMLNSDASTTKDGKLIYTDVNTDNMLGLPNTMDANICINGIIANAKTENPDRFVQSIEDMANNIPGFVGLHKLVNDLKNNEDFKIRLYRQFRKSKITKKQTIYGSEDFKNKTTNQTADAKTTLTYQFLNNLRSSVLSLDSDDYKSVSDKLKTAINNIKILKANLEISDDKIKTQQSIDAKYNEVYDCLDTILCDYYPNLTRNAIISYINKYEKNGKVDPYTNALDLATIVDTILGQVYPSRLNYEKERNRASDVKFYNKQAEKTNKALKPTNDLFKEDYLTQSLKAATIQLIDKFKDYIFINTVYTHRNSENNMCSDIINNSTMTNSNEAFQNKQMIKNMGVYRIGADKNSHINRSAQYNYSNIFIEHKDSNGNVINKGFFRITDNGNLEVTDDATKLMRVSMFDGTTNEDTNEGAPNTALMGNDINIAKIINFFDAEQPNSDNAEIKDRYADYHMRVPSDAPRNFLISAPRLSIKGLFVNKQVDKNHSVFQQYKNQVKQELLNAAVAIDVIFENENGVVKPGEIKQGKIKPKFKDNFATDVTKLYEGYHYKGNSVLDSNGKLTGEVFKSNRFIVKKIVDGKYIETNYGQNIFDNAFDFLYGGADTALKTRINPSTGMLELDLTPAQEKEIDDQLSKYLVDYAATEIPNLIDIEALPKKYKNKELLAEYLYNYQLMSYSFDELFEGDSKFYVKGFADFLKRAKQVQGSGVAYGIVDFLADRTAPTKTVDSIINKETFEGKDENGNPKVLNKFAYDTAIKEGKTEEEAIKIANSIVQTNRFKAITVKNTQKRSDNVAIAGVEKDTENGQLTNKLIQVLQKELSPEVAQKKATEMMKSFYGVKINDAQSYITFEEWVRRIAARGQYTEYKQLIKDILDESKPINEETLTKFIQVQKNFYFDHYYNSLTKTVSPRQIKNAEFVLIPRFIKGTELEQVYYAMQEAGIGQLNTKETTKASKSKIVTLWNNDGVITKDNFDKFKLAVHSNDDFVEEFDYTNLYTQQETPQHMNAENKASIQIMKKILDNIPDDHPRLKELKDRFSYLYSSNIEISAKDFLSKLNIDIDNLDETINNIDYELLNDLFREQMLSRGADENMLDYVNGNMPKDMSINSTKMESIAQAIFNNRITRQTLPGFHAAQISNVGFSSSDEISFRETGITGVKRDGDLKYHPAIYQLIDDENVTISEKEWHDLPTDEERKKYIAKVQAYCEIRLPRSAFKFDDNNYAVDEKGNIIYDTVVNEAGKEVKQKRIQIDEKHPDGKKTNEELLKELQDQGLDMIIGYRIPTEGKQSICVMKITELLPAAYGSTIVVPNDWVAQTGSDFDIDSVYAINYKATLNKNGKLEKINFKYEASDADFYNYIRSITKEDKLVIDNDDLSKLAKEKAKEKTKEEKQKLAKLTKDTNDALKANRIKAKQKLPDNIKQILKTNVTDKFEAYYGIPAKEFNRDQYDNMLRGEIDILTQLLNAKLSDKVKDAIKIYGQTIANTINNIADTQEKIDEINKKFNDVRTEEYKILKQQQIDDYHHHLESLAAEQGITKEEFKTKWKEDPAKFNSKDARNNAILDTMIAILSDEDSLIENLSCSKFVHVIEGRDEFINPAIQKFNAKRSPYNPIDQSSLHADVMAGRMLKAISVVRDNLNSVCNVNRAIVHNDYILRIRYSKDKISENVSNSFDIEENSDNNDTIIVKHNRFGNSKDNKNITGDLLTPYSSETTAHQLDVVKEGVVPNVNDYTFGVYKTFVDMGSDFRTACGFIMQPAITKMVEFYNSANSIYSDKKVNPIDAAIEYYVKEIAKLYKIDLSNAKNLTSKISAIQGCLDDFKRFFDTKSKDGALHMFITATNDFVFDADLMKTRINCVDDFRNSNGSTNDIQVYTGSITENDTDVMVFASNLSGNNGDITKNSDSTSTLALKQKRINQGEVVNNTISKSGKAYGITMSKKLNRKDKFTIAQITKNIQDFYEYAKAHPTQKFKVAYNETEDNKWTFEGYTHEQIASAFLNAGDIPTNVYFHESWLNNGYLSSSLTKEQAVYDLGILIQYKKLNAFNEKINAVTRVLNVDKFGAKPSIFQARAVFSNLENAAINCPFVNEKTGKNLIESVYPGVKEFTDIDDDATYDSDTDLRDEVEDNKLKSFITNKEQSSYPSLNALMKYTAAISLLINKRIFKTQSNEFDGAIKSIAKSFTKLEGKNRTCTERVYNDFKRYVVNLALITAPTIQQSIIIGNNDNLILNQNTDIEAERRRIFGFGKGAAVTVEIGEEIKPFTVVNFTNPTDAELTRYCKLSPAQKIKWLKDNVENLGILQYIEATLINPNAHNATLEGRHTLRFNDNSINLSDARRLFKDMYYNSNPLYKLAMIDIVKYVALVEGFKPLKNSISQIIPNEILYKSIDDEGLGITEHFDTALSSLIDGSKNNDSYYKNNYEDNELINRITDSYIRSKYPELNQISSRKIGNSTKTTTDSKGNETVQNKGPELIPTKYGIIRVELKSENKEQNPLISKYNIGIKQNDKLELNKYVKLIHRDKSLVLYKTYQPNPSGAIYLIPVNKLENNEIGDYSCNVDNNKFHRESTLLAIIDTYRHIQGIIAEYNDSVETWNAKGEGSQLPYAKYITFADFCVDPAKSINDILELKINHRDYAKSLKDSVTKEATSIDPMVEKDIIPKIKDNTKLAAPFDINEDTPINNKVRGKIEEHFSNTLEPLYLDNFHGFENYIRYAGFENGSPQTINGSFYVIYKLDASKMTNIRKAIDNKTPINKLTYLNTQEKEIVKKYSNTDEPLNNVFVVSKQDEYFESSIDEALPGTSPYVTESIMNFGKAAINAINELAKANNDDLTISTVDDFNAQEIYANDNAIKDKLGTVYKAIAEYIDFMHHQLELYITHFCKIDDEWVKVNDARVIDYIKNKPEEQIRFLKVMQDYMRLAKKFESIIDINTDSAPEYMRRDIKVIKNIVNQIQTNPIIREAEKNFINDFLAQQSDDPRVREGMLEVINGYHFTDYITNWFGDLQANPNTLLQIVTKHVMADIRSKELVGKEAVRENNAKVDDIKKRAKDNGRPIDLSHVIDDNGKFIQEYDESFKDKIEELQDALNDAIVKYGKNSVEHLIAKYNYDKFKLNHVHQAVIDDYYARNLQITEEMLSKYPAIYSAYKKLADKRSKILKHTKDGVLSDEYQKQLDEVNTKINNLSANYIYDPDTQTYTEKYYYNHPDNPYPKGSLERELNSIEAANALRHYLKEYTNLIELFNTTDASFGFAEKLEEVLDTIQNFEILYGDSKIPMSELIKHEDYVKAKTWLAHNARFQLTSEAIQEVKEALEYLKMDSNLKDPVLKYLAKQKQAYDEEGTIDGNKFNETEIEKIKKADMARLNITEQATFTDTILISNANKDIPIFQNSFYSGLKSAGLANERYLEIVQEINSILAPHYDHNTKTVWTSELTEEELNKLAELYDKIQYDPLKDAYLKELKARKENGEISIGEYYRLVEEFKHDNNVSKSFGNIKTAKFINDRCAVLYNVDAFEQQRIIAEAKGERYYNAWLAVNYPTVNVKKGNTIVAEANPNNFLYGSIVPKEYAQYVEFLSNPNVTEENLAVLKARSKINQEKTDAVSTIKRFTEKNNTAYYYAKFKEMQARGKEEFDAWYKANHIYNPHTHEIEPISCWTKIDFTNPDISFEKYNPSNWAPSFGQRVIKVKDEFKNPKFNTRNPSLIANYKPEGITLKLDEILGTTDNSINNTINFDNLKDNTDYNNKIKQTPEEKELKEHWQNIVQDLSKTNAAKKRADRGNAPARAIQKSDDSLAKVVGKETLKFFGIVEGSTGLEPFNNDIRYDNYVPAPMPMMQALKSKESIKVDYNRPLRSSYPEGAEGDTKYNEALDKWRKDKKEAETVNNEIHKQLLDKNWEEVMNSFITQAYHYNAVQDAKYLLLFAKDKIANQEVYDMTTFGDDMTKKNEAGKNSESYYSSTKDTRLNDQYNTWLNRLLFNQYKQKEGAWVKIANGMQGFVSAKYMMLNITGGIANITVGKAQVFMESIAGDLFDNKSWAAGQQFWWGGSLAYMADMFSEKASNLQSAIVKYFDVVDFDTLAGVVTVEGAAKYTKRVRDFLYSPQAIGEHYMQNSVLFTMLMSHRLVKNPDPTNGRTSYEAMSKEQYVQSAREVAFTSVLTDELKEKFKKFKESVKANANVKKDFALGRKDIITYFLRIYCNDAQGKDIQRNFIKLEKDLRDKREKEFDKFERLIDNLDFKDGEMTFKEGKTLFTCADKHQILGTFKNRVIATNKKIHGWYDKLGGGSIEKTIFGGLITQYHKHLVPGFLKRWRKRGYFNEERGTMEKGSYISLWDFIKMPFEEYSFREKLKEELDCTDEELQVLGSFKTVMSILKDYANSPIKDLLPEYEKTNIRRIIGELAGVVMALGAAILCYLGFDDDDDEKNNYSYLLFKNLLIYELDRLNSELLLYNPYGAYAEGQKLLSSPIAAETIIEDCFKLGNLIIEFATEDEWDPNYKSGLHAKDSKFKVLVIRNIPVYHGINNIMELPRKNKYYKLEDNLASYITRQIKNGSKY